MSDTEATAFVVETIGGDEPIPVIAVHGQADLHTAPQLRAAITTVLDGGAAASSSTSPRRASSTR